jgi:hypothetical protein
VPVKIRRGPARLFHESPVVQKCRYGTHRLTKAIASDGSASSEGLQQRMRSRQT